MVNEIGAIDNLKLENQLTKLTSLVRQLAVGQHQPSIAARVCVWKATISAKAESRAICDSVIRTCTKCTSRSNRLLTTGSTISDTTVPTVTTTDSVSSRQLTISGRLDEAVSDKEPRVPSKHELQ
ncbi:hypothetical protein CR513_26604, partial [Mucuna pruriens]